MPALALPPPLWTPPKPAIIRSAEKIVTAESERRRLGILMPPPFIASATPPVLTYNGDAGASAGNPSTASGIPIGTATPDRVVILCFFAYFTSTGRTINSGTINGSAATMFNAISRDGGGNCNALAMFRLLVTSGTTASCSISLSANPNGCRMSSYSLTGWQSQVPFDTASDVTGGSAATAVTLNVPAGGATIGGGVNVNNGRSVAWTGLTEDFDPGQGRSSASLSLMSAQTARAISMLWGGSENCAMAAASWS